MAQEIKDQGYVKIDKLNLLAQGKTLDLMNYTNRIDIYESILSPGVICELIISDAITIYSSFMTGSKIEISFTTHEGSPPVEYTFKIIKKDDIGSPRNDKAVVYRVTSVTEETYTAANIKNLPLVRGKDVLVEEPVLAMLNALNSKKELFLEKTTGLHSVSSAGITPFDFINRLRMIAVSAKYKASAFVFFENKHGFTFKCLETLVEEGLSGIGDKLYIYHPAANLDVTGSNWRTILGAKQIQIGNENVAGLIGGNKNVSSQFDVHTGELIKYDNDVAASFESISMNENSSWIDTRRMSEYHDDGRQSVVLYDSSSDKHQVAEKDNYLPYYIAKFLTVIQHITVYGDSTVTIGDIIKVRFPERSGLTEAVELDQNLSGNYMVCKCRHSIILGGAFPMYFQGLEIIKDGVGGDMPT